MLRTQLALSATQGVCVQSDGLGVVISPDDGGRVARPLQGTDYNPGYGEIAVLAAVGPGICWLWSIPSLCVVTPLTLLVLQRKWQGLK